MTTLDLTSQSLQVLAYRSVQRQGFVDPDARYIPDPDPFIRPTPETQGWDCGSSPAAMLHICTREHLSRDTVYIVFAPDASDYGGDYSFGALGGDPAARTISAGATLDQALILWQDTLADEFTTADIEIVSFRERGGSNDAIRIRFAGIFSSGTRVESLSGPAAAQLRLVREVYSVSPIARIRSTVQPAGEITNSESSRNQRNAWAQAPGAVLPALLATNLATVVNVGTADRMHIELGAVTHFDDAMTIVTSGDGLYGVHDAVSVSVEPTVTK